MTPAASGDDGAGGEVPVGVEFELLGAVTVRIGGVEVDSGHARQRCVLACLALEVNRPVQTEQLIDRVWADRPPQRARQALAGYVSRLRQILSSTGEVAIRRRPDGYVLAADPMAVDVHSFHDLTARARLCADGEQACGLYRRALALWRGEAFAGMDTPWLNAIRASLDAQRLAAELDYHDLALGQGAHSELLAVLSERAQAHPLDERLAGQLLLALYRCGRQADALQHYEQVRLRLADELGADPGLVLQQRYAAILRQDAELDLPATATPSRQLHTDIVSGQPETATVGEERKLVTVLAADFRGSQSSSDPERTRRETSSWTDILCEVVDRWGGAVERLVGGGVVAVFGYPAAREDHVARALWAGFEILQRVSVPVRLGIDTGAVIAPAAGTGSLSGLGGDVLDVTARLREAAKPGTALVSDRARLAAHGDFRFGPAVRLGRFGACPLLAADWPASQPRPEFEPPMVGRDDEIRVVLSLIDDAAASGHPRLVTIVAAAGIGKSRLVREVVAAALVRRPDTTVVRGRCLAAGDGITYWALGEILRDACGVALGEASHITQPKLRERLRHLLASEQSDVDDTIFALAATAAIPMPGSPLDKAPPRAVADALAQAWPRFATAAASHGPLIMVVEDLHWAGEPLLDMLFRLVARSSGPVVVLTTARPEFLEQHPGFGAASAEVSMISLRSLTERASRELLDSLPRALALGVQRREEILVRAEGNPYFLEQLVAHLAEGRSDTLPDTLHALLAARVDALPVTEKRLLQAAAVVGRVFWVEPLRDRLGYDIAGPLAALEIRGLLLARRTSSLSGQVEFAFKHALLHDVAYASLPAAQRARGHADVAEWLEEISQDRVGEVMELVAYHYTAAADGWDAVLSDQGEAELITASAFRSLIRAGVGARRRYAIAKAVELHRHALDYAANTSDRAEAVEAVGDDHEVAFDGDAAVEAWQSAIEMLRPDPRWASRRAALCLKTAQMAVARWGGFRVPADPVMADRLIDEGLAVVTDQTAKAQLLTLRALCTGRWSWTGLPDPVPVIERRRAAEAGLQLADRLGVPPLQGFARRGMAAVHLVDGDYEDAVLAMIEYVDLLGPQGRSRDRALAHAIASLFISDIRGDYEHALAHARNSLAVAQELFPHDRMHGTFAVMTCLERLGRWSEIEPYLDEHLQLLSGQEASVSCPYLRGGPLVAALAFARLGDVQRARDLAARTPANLDYPAQAEVIRAELAIELGDASTGRQLAERLVRLGRRPAPEEIPHETLVLVEALEALSDHGALLRILPAARAASSYLAVLTPACDRAEGRACAAAGDIRGARALLTQAVAGFDAMSVPLQAARSREHLAEVCPDRTDELLRAALHSYARLGAKRDLARAEFALAVR